MKFSNKILLLTLLLPSVILGGIYDKIALENLKSITPVIETRPEDIHLYSQHLKWNFGKQVNLNAADKRRFVFTMMQEYEKTHPLKTADVLDYTSWQDLNLLCGPKSNNDIYLAQKIDRTSTELGKISLFRMIIDPLTTVETLRERQAIIRELLHNKELFEKLDHAFQNLKKSENLLYSFWQEDTFQHAVQRKTITLPWKFDVIDELNKNSHVVEARERLDQAGQLMLLATEVAGIVVLPSAAVLFLANYIPQAKRLRDFAQNRLYVSPVVGFFSIMGVASFLLNQMVPNRLTNAASNAAVGINYGTQIYYSFDFFKSNILVLTYLQEKLIAVAHFTNALMEFEKLINESGVLRNYLTAAQSINHVITDLPEQSQDFKKLLELLSSDTFKGEASFFSRAGRILATYKLMSEQKHHLIEALIALGEIDAYMSIARLYKEGQDRANTWSFATYTDSKLGECANSECAVKQTHEPSVLIENFWNPFIDSVNAVANSAA